MSSASYPVLLSFFEHHLQFTPTPSQLARFERDLALVSPDLMLAALKEAAAKRALAGQPFANQREAILTIYYRKVAEHARLFPIFHTFETAFRSTVTVDLETHYGRATWWVPVRDAIARLGTAQHVRHLYGVPLSQDRAHLIARIVTTVERTQAGVDALDAATSGYDFTALCDLAHIGELVEQHWSVFQPLHFVAPRPMTRQEFNGKFRAVRDARNAAYHHRSITGMTSVVRAAEDLLDRLGCSLAFTYDKIAGANASPLTFKVEIESQDNLF